TAGKENSYTGGGKIAFGNVGEGRGLGTQGGRGGNEFQGSPRRAYGLRKEEHEAIEQIAGVGSGGIVIRCGRIRTGAGRADYAAAVVDSGGARHADGAASAAQEYSGRVAGGSGRKRRPQDALQPAKSKRQQRQSRRVRTAHRLSRRRHWRTRNGRAAQSW